MKKINAPRTISQSRDTASSGWIGFQGSDCSFHLPQGNLIRERAGLFAFVTLVCRRHTIIDKSTPAIFKVTNGEAVLETAKRYRICRCQWQLSPFYQCGNI